LKYRILHNTPLEFFNTSADLVGSITANGTNLKISSVSGVIELGNTATDIQVGTIGTAVNWSFMGGGTIGAAGGGTISLGQSGDTVNMNVAGVTYQYPASFLRYNQITGVNNKIDISTSVPGSVILTLPNRPVVGQLSLTDNIAANSNTTGTLQVAGGASFTGNLYAGNVVSLGGITVEGSLDPGSGDYAGWRANGTNIILKGNDVGRSGIFFQSEKNGVNINHPTDYGYIQFHPMGIDGSTGESNKMVIGVANDADDFLVLQSPYKNGVKISFKDATSGTGGTEYTVWHAGNHGTGSGLDADLLDGLNSTSFANSVYDQAGFDKANTAQTTAAAAFNAANTAQTTATAGFTAANTAQTTASAAFNAANTAQTTATNALSNTVQVLTVNSATRIVVANTTATTSNVTGALIVTGGVGVSGNIYTGNHVITGTGNGITFVDGTIQTTAVNSTFVQSGFNQANSAILSAQGAFEKGNTAILSAQGAFNLANTSAQLAYSNITVNGVLISADVKQSNLTLTSGNGVTLLANAVVDSINVGLTTTGVNAGTYGSANSVPIITIDTQGRITFANAVSIGSSSGASAGYPRSSLTTVYGTLSSKDLRTGPDNVTAETPFDRAVDAFGVLITPVYDCMDPVGSYVTFDLNT